MGEFMATVIVQDNIEQVIKRLGTIPTKIVVPATNSALNKTITKMHTDAVKAVSSYTGIKKKTLKGERGLIVIKSNFRELRARLQARRLYKNLIEHVSLAQQKRSVTGQNKKGVRAKAWNRSKNYKGTQIIENRRGRLIVVKRKEGKLKQVFAPDIPNTLDRKKIKEPLIKNATKYFIKNFRHELKFRLSRLK